MLCAFAQNLQGTSETNPAKPNNETNLTVWRGDYI